MRDKIGVGYALVSDVEKKYVNMALDAGRLSQGEFVYKFEKKFATLHGQTYGIACNSGTSALHVALEALKEKYNWQAEAEVLVPAITFIASSNACLHAHLKPIFVDVDYATYNMDPGQIENHITKRTVAIMPVHTFGQPCEMDDIVSVANRYGLKIIEDCAEAHFAKYKGKTIGSFGELACFSTYVAHTITTGIGGVIITKEADLSAICRSLIAHGRACTCERCLATDPGNVCKLRMKTSLDKRFMMVRLGYSYRIGELEGALGLAQLENKDFIMAKRKENAKMLTQRLDRYSEYLQLPKPNVYIEHSYMMYPIVVRPNSKVNKRELVEFLENSNIETRPMLPLLNQPIYQAIFGDLEKDYPVAKWINNNGFYIGCHHGLGLEEIDYIASIFDKYFMKKYISKSKTAEG